MIRSYEGTMRLQGIGIVEGIKAKNIQVGDELVWNFGEVSVVKEITFSKTGKTLTITVEYANYSGEIETAERRLNAERIVAVKDLNPVEVEEVVETEEMKANFEEAKKWLGYVRKYKDMKFYGEAQVYYRRYRKAGGVQIIEQLEHPERYEELLEEDEAEVIAKRIVANRPRMERKAAFQRWVERFIEEKGLNLDHEFIFTHEGNTHFISLEFLVELMFKAPKHEQEQIKNKIVYIDFRNGDIMHFFEFLAKAYIKTNY